MFEYVYLARPDSIMDGISVYQARLNMGETLAKRLISTVPPNEIDVVIPIPESSRPSAMQLAQRIGKPYREGFVKNRYVGRTFIMPGQGERKKSVRQKLNAIEVEFKGRNVLLVDDSIVRGTTSQEIVQMARDAGANKVYLARPDSIMDGFRLGFSAHWRACTRPCRSMNSASPGATSRVTLWQIGRASCRERV